MQRRRLLAMLLPLAVALGACGDGAEQDAAEPDPETGSIGEPQDLDDGVAAAVNGSEIGSAAVEERFDAVSEVPEMAEQLEGEQGEQVAGMLRAQILQNLIVQEIVADGAEDLGVEPSAEDVAAVEDQAIAEFDGDREAYERALEAEGITPEQRDKEFRFAARVAAIRDVVAADAEELEDEAGDTGLAPEDLALQEWFGERLAASDVAVDQEYGLWDPQSGQVVPGGAPQGAG